MLRFICTKMKVGSGDDSNIRKTPPLHWLNWLNWPEESCGPMGGLEFGMPKPTKPIYLPHKVLGDEKWAKILANQADKEISEASEQKKQGPPEGGTCSVN